MQEELDEKIVHDAAGGMGAAPHQVADRLSPTIRRDEIGEGQDLAIISGRSEHGRGADVVRIEFPQRELPLAAARDLQPFVGNFSNLGQDFLRDGRLVIAGLEARLFQLPGPLELLGLLPLGAELSEIDDRLVADLEFLKTQTLVDREEIRKRLMKAQGPIVVPAECHEASNDVLDLLFGANRIGERHGEIPSHAVGQKATVRRGEEKGFVRPELEVILGGAAILVDDAGGQLDLVGVRAVAVDDGAEQREQGIADGGSRHQVERILEPLGVTGERMKVRVANQGEEQQGAAEGVAKGEVDAEVPRLEQPQTPDAVTNG